MVRQCSRGSASVRNLYAMCMRVVLRTTSREAQMDMGGVLPLAALGRDDVGGGGEDTKKAGSKAGCSFMERETRFAPSAAPAATRSEPTRDANPGKPPVRAL
jgi:hypothetical protein